MVEESAYKKFSLSYRFLRLAYITTGKWFGKEPEQDEIEQPKIRYFIGAECCTAHGMCVRSKADICADWDGMEWIEK